MKECKKCFTQIDTRATICPHCKSSQRLWGHPSASDLLGIIALVIVAGLIGYVEYDKNQKKNNTGRYTELKASVLQVNKYKDSDGLRVSCNGEITNPTNEDFYYVYYEITFFNSKDELVDIANILAENINVLANSKTKFRANISATNPDAEYSKCHVNITKAFIR